MHVIESFIKSPFKCYLFHLLHANFLTGNTTINLIVPLKLSFWVVSTFFSSLGLKILQRAYVSKYIFLYYFLCLNYSYQFKKWKKHSMTLDSLSHLLQGRDWGHWHKYSFLEAFWYVRSLGGPLVCSNVRFNVTNTFSSLLSEQSLCHQELINIKVIFQVTSLMLPRGLQFGLWYKRVESWIIGKSHTWEKLVMLFSYKWVPVHEISKTCSFCL